MCKAIEDSGYGELREHLIKVGVDEEIVQYLGGMSLRERAKVLKLFKKTINNDMLFILSIDNFEYVKSYIDREDDAEGCIYNAD